jgi:hypothetical protein
MEKAVNVLKVISSLVFLATLLFVYSLLPIMVKLNPADAAWSVHKEYFFYGSIIFFIVLNIFLIAMERMISPLINMEEIRAWIKGLAFVLNFYLACLIGSIGVFNNQSNFLPGSYAYLNFVGPILLLAWVGGLIFIRFNSTKTA